MARFLRNAISLSEWVRSHGTVRKAIDAISSLPGMQKESLTDITEMTRRILSGNNSDNAANTLFRIFASHGITEDHVTDASSRADQAQVADDLLKSKVISSDEHTTMLKQAQVVRQTGIYDMPLRFCPKLPKQTAGKGLVSTFNCREYCSESLVLDDDPMRVYCLETMWRQHVMDKFSREWKDRETGEWVGGYINNRFFSFPTAGTPANPDAPRDGGNPLQLKPGERTRQPRPHEWSTERRLQEQRNPKSTESIVLAQAGEDNMIKLASKGSEYKRDGIYQAFSEAIRLHKDGVPASDAALTISEACSMPIGMVVRIQEAAIRKVKAHVSDVYRMSKTAESSVEAMDIAQDAKALGLTEKSKPQPSACPHCGKGYDPKDPTGHMCQQMINKGLGLDPKNKIVCPQCQEAYDTESGHQCLQQMTKSMSSYRGNYKKASKEVIIDDLALAEVEKAWLKKASESITTDKFVCKECNNEVFGGIENLKDHLIELHSPDAAKMTSDEVLQRFSHLVQAAASFDIKSPIGIPHHLKAKAMEIMSQYPNALKAFSLGARSGNDVHGMDIMARVLFVSDVITISEGASPSLSASDYYKKIKAIESAKVNLENMENEYSQKQQTEPSAKSVGMDGIQTATASIHKKQMISGGGSSNQECGCSLYEAERRQGSAVSYSGSGKSCQCKTLESASQE